MLNLWKITDLPSKFLFYKPKFFYGRPLTVIDIKYLTTINNENYDEICNELLNRCINFNGLKITDLNPNDYLYLLFWLKANSFVKSGFNLKTNCPYCNTEITKEYTLDDLNVKYIKPEYYSKKYNFMKSSYIFTIKIPTISKIINNLALDQEILKIASYIDTINNYTVNQLQAYEAINNMDPLDFSKFNSLYKQFEFGIDSINITCPKCHKIFNCLLNFDKSIFSEINLLDILESDIRISKYTNRAIKDDDPWIEIELRQQIINKLKEEEQQEIEKMKHNKISLSHSIPNMSSTTKMPNMQNSIKMPKI